MSNPTIPQVPEGFLEFLKTCSLIELLQMSNEMKTIPEDANYRAAVKQQIFVLTGVAPDATP